VKLQIRLVNHLRLENSNVRRDDVDNLVANTNGGRKAKVPTATLRELFIFNDP
jgi:hypothetical protein